MGYDGKQDALSETVIASAPASATRVSRADSRFQAVLVQYAKKVPAQTFEVAVRSLNPLAARALENLPRAGGVPVIRAIGKEDALGFTFLFKIAPEELVASEIPALLERWDGKYEAARAKAFPPPAATPAPQPLAPRSPFRKPAAEDSGDGQAQREVFVRDLSVVERALAKYEAQVVADSIAQGSEPVIMDPATPAPDDDADLVDPYASEAAALSDAQGSLQLGAPAAADGGWVDLTPLSIYIGQQDACPPGAPQIVDGNGGIWASWVTVTLEPHGPDVLAPLCQALPVDALQLTPEQRQQARAIQEAVAARVQASAPALTQALRACMKSITAAQRRSRASAALAQAAGALALLDELLGHLQLAQALVTRIDRHAPEMPVWAIEVREALAAGAVAHANYLEATGPLQALRVLDVWCAPLVPLRLTEQMGLFAQPAAVHLQHQLQHLIELAKQWDAIAAKRTPGECARVIAAWSDIVRGGGTPQPDEKKS